MWKWAIRVLLIYCVTFFSQFCFPLLVVSNCSFIYIYIYFFIYIIINNKRTSGPIPLTWFNLNFKLKMKESCMYYKGSQTYSVNFILVKLGAT